MNMWLHGYPEASIAGKNTIASPQFTENGQLKRFDFVVANPPFSIKNWDTGIVPLDDEYNRFRCFGVPPDKNGDYAFLLHIIASLKSTGKGAIILPHGVLFRGNAEAAIRQNIIERKWIKGVIGLPANLFYGTGIPACIIVIDKEHTEERDGIFMMDASKGFIKDGNKNRLREQDIHQIVDVFNTQTEVEKYARFVPFEEIEKNEYNLNIPRYVDTQEEEDIQDLNAHLNGGIPNKDIEGLSRFWEVYPNLKAHLFSRFRENYSQLNVAASDIKNAIYSHPEFTNYSDQLALVFESWKEKVYADLQGINEQTAPKKLEKHIAEALLHEYDGKPLVNQYAMYQHFMDYWDAMMKDDVYLLAEDGWVAKTKRILEKNSKGKEVDKGWTCDLIPKQLVIDNYLASEQQALNDLVAQLETKQAEITTYNEEHAGEEGVLNDATNDKGTITKTTLTKYLNTIKGDKTEKEAYDLGNKLLTAFAKEATLKKQIKMAEQELDASTLKQFGKLTEPEVRTLVVDDKWITTISEAMQSEIDSISQRLTGRIKELAERYENTLGQLDKSNTELEEKVAGHLEKMGFVWS